MNFVLGLIDVEVPDFCSPIEALPDKFFNMGVNMLVTKLMSKPIEWCWNKLLPPYEKPVTPATILKEMMEEKMMKQDMEQMEQEIEQTENDKNKLPETAEQAKQIKEAKKEE